MIQSWTSISARQSTTNQSAKVLKRAGPVGDEAESTAEAHKGAGKGTTAGKGTSESTGDSTEAMPQAFNPLANQPIQPLANQVVQDRPATVPEEALLQLMVNQMNAISERQQQMAEQMAESQRQQTEALRQVASLRTPAPHEHDESTKPFLSGDFLRDSSNPLDVYEDSKKNDTTKAKNADTTKAKDANTTKAKDADTTKAKDAEKKAEAKGAGAHNTTANSSAANATNGTQNAINTTAVGKAIDAVKEVGAAIDTAIEALGTAKDALAGEDTGEIKPRWKYCMFLSLLLWVGCCCFSGAAHSNLGQLLAGFFNFVVPFMVILYLCDTTTIFHDWWSGKPVSNWCRLVCIWAFLQIAIGIGCLGFSMLGIGVAATMGYKTEEEKQLEKKQEEKKTEDFKILDELLQ